MKQIKFDYRIEETFNCFYVQKFIPKHRKHMKGLFISIKVDATWARLDQDGNPSINPCQFKTITLARYFLEQLRKIPKPIYYYD